jgi:hypothetical protein
MVAQYNEFVARDIVNMCKPLLDSPEWFIDPFTGKISPKNTGIDHTTPWVHVNRDTERKCEYWMPLFALTGIRPKKCHECWKVVVRLSTLSDLFLLSDFMNFDIEHPCKCGWDNRTYTSGVYAGYFYNDSREQGLYTLEKVRAGLKNVLEFDNQITLKRGCTEMEIEHGDKWEHTVKDQVTERLFIDNVLIEGGNEPQPDIVKLHVMRKWIENAARIGDQTVKKHNGGEMLAPSLKNYEE